MEKVLKFIRQLDGIDFVTLMVVASTLCCFMGLIFELACRFLRFLTTLALSPTAAAFWGWAGVVFALLGFSAVVGLLLGYVRNRG